MEDELTAQERDQLRRIAALQKVALGILLKWLPWCGVMFVALTVFFSVILVWHFAYSGHRFDAVTRLLFTPRVATGIEGMSDRQLMSIIERNTLKRRVAERMPMSAAERSCLTIDLEITQERRPSNLYTLKAKASSWVGAVKKVNAYASVLIDEYIAYRKRDLDNLRESMLVRKKTMQDHIAEIEIEEGIAKGKAGVAAPVETLTMINALLSDQRKNLSLISVDIANEEARKAKYESQIGKAGPVIIENAAVIRRKCEAIEAIDKEIAQLRDIYTDLNPKVIGKLDDRKEMIKAYSDFLKGKGIENVMPDDITRMEKVAGDLATSMMKLEALRESQRSLQQEIADNERKSEELIAVIPAIERLRIKREDQEKALRDLEVNLDNITFQQMSVETDLQQIEKAGGAGDKDPLRPVNFGLAAIGAFICTAAVAFWILALEFVFGKVRGAKELGAYGDIAVLGSIPKQGAVPEDEEMDIMGVVALNYCNVELPKGVVLVCRLPGAVTHPKFQEALDWSLTMAGQRCFGLKVVASAGFEPPEDSEMLINTVRKGAFGWFPVANRFSFAPTELQMLQADLATLREEYDSVFIVMPDGLRKGGSFFSQLIGASESVVVEIGTDATSRSDLDYVRRHVKEAGKPMMGLVMGASARTVRKEMEAKK